MTKPQVKAERAGIVGIISFMNAGGAQEAMLRLARQMRARGRPMEVWFLYEQNAIHADEPYVRVFFKKPALSPLEYALACWMLVRSLAARRPASVIGFLPLGCVLGLTAAWLTGVPVRIASQRSLGTTFGRAMRSLDRWAGSSPVYQRVVCVSHAVAASFSDYPQAYVDKLSVIHNGIEWTPSPLSKQEARQSLGLPRDAFVFAAVGRTQLQKNYPILIDTIAAVDDVLLVVAGGGDLRPQLEARAKALGVSDRVIFLGALTKAKCRELLRSADAFVQSSLFEGQSNAVLEAMHEGLPIIVSDIPEQRETVVDDETGEVGGLLVDLDRPSDWVDALRRVRDEPDLRASLGSSAQALVVRRFSIDRMGDAFEKVLTGSHI